MDFLAGIISSIIAFFGGGTSVPAPAPDAYIAEEVRMSDQTDMSASSTEVQMSDLVQINDDENSALGEVDSPEETTDSMVSEPEAVVTMAGEAKPITPPTVPVAVLPADIRTMLVAGGCFWCVESDLEKLSGVIGVVSGYAGGTTENPTYKNYGSGGHREVVEVTYDANRVSFEDILIVTMKTTDPTDDEGTFKDRGDKYSAAFYYETPAQKAIIDSLIKEVDEFGPYDKPLAIDVEPRATFWKAEDNHQDYYKGTLTQLKYQYYRNASGRNALIERYWGTNTGPSLPWRTSGAAGLQTNNNRTSYMWTNYVKPSEETLKAQLDAVTFKVTQEDGTERAGTSPLDKNWERGIYVDILSGEPLYSSKDKFDSGTGWPSFVKPITPASVTEHEDRGLFSVRTEIRSAIADNHLGHVFTDGPRDRGGLRYCMNGVSLRFVPEAEMATAGYSDFLQYL